MTAPVSASSAALQLAQIAQLPQPAASEPAATPQPLFQRSDSVQISNEAQALLAAEQATAGG